MQALRKLLVTLLIGVSFFFIAAFLVPNRANPNGHSILALALIALAWLYPFVAFHELGHFLAAKFVRFRPLALVVGPFETRFEESRTRITFNLFSSSPYLGHVVAIPNDDRNLKSRFFLLYAGGALADLLVASCALAATLLATDAVSLPIVYVVRGALIAAAWLLYIDLIPSKRSDLLKIIRLLLSHTLSRPVAIATIAGQSLSGVRPRDWSKSLVSLLDSVSDKTEESAWSRLLEYYHALDSGEFPDALEHLAKAQECGLKDNKILQTMLCNERAYASAVCGDLATARSSLDQIDSSLHEHSLLRTKAAIAEAEGNFTQAKTYAQQALAAQDKCNDKGWIIAERDILASLLSRVQRVPQSPDSLST